MCSKPEKTVHPRQGLSKYIWQSTFNYRHKLILQVCSLNIIMTIAYVLPAGSLKSRTKSRLDNRLD